MRIRAAMGLLLLSVAVSSPLSAQVEKVVADAQGIT